MTVPAPSFFQRLSIAISAFFRALGDAQYAAQLGSTGPQLPAAQPEPQSPAIKPARDLRPALQLLSALQREGRLVDFVQQDITTFGDADVGSAARVVHEGCGRALHGILQLAPVMSEAEGQVVSVPAGYDAHTVRLVGNVSGQPPYRGKLQHKGWRAQQVTLPEVIGESDCSVIAPAEVEL